MSPVERRLLPWALVVGTFVAALGCGSLDTPTEPKPNTNSSSTGGSSDGGGGNSGLVLGAPATPAPSPSASPSPDAAASPDPGGGKGEGASDCGDPLPPAITIVDVKVHIRGAEAYILDSTPLVGPNAADYCRKIGFTDGRSVCPVRPEGNPQRSACELYAIGRAKDTSRPGPTWYRNGNFCGGKATGCENSGDNQYLLYAYASGKYKACTSSGACGELQVDR